jgi:hypothetical protein
MSTYYWELRTALIELKEGGGDVSELQELLTGGGDYEVSLNGLKGKKASSLSVLATALHASVAEYAKNSTRLMEQTENVSTLDRISKMIGWDGSKEDMETLDAIQFNNEVSFVNKTVDSIVAALDKVYKKNKTFDMSDAKKLLGENQALVDTEITELASKTKEYSVDKEVTSSIASKWYNYDVKISSGNNDPHAVVDGEAYFPRRGI